MPFIGRVFYMRIGQGAAALALLALTFLTAYVTYQHWVFMRRLPPATWRPLPLTAPLSEDVLWGDPVRWVEITAAVGPPAPGGPALYRNATESPGALVLHFAADPGNPGRRAYRGLLQTYGTRRAKYRYPDALAQTLRAHGITPGRPFAVLSVNQSPWPLWAPQVKEASAVAGGLCIMLFLFFAHVRRVMRLRLPVDRPPSAAAADKDSPSGGPGHSATTNPPSFWLRRLAVTASVLALTWLLYRSVCHRPVIPAESLWLGGLSAVLSLAGSFKQWRGHRRRLISLEHEFRQKCAV